MTLKANRFDLLCLGVNEIYSILQNSGNSEAIVMERNITLNYPFPVFFYSNLNNQKHAQQLQEGFEHAFKRGTFQKAYFQHFHKELTFSQLWNRQVITLNNDYINTVNEKYKSFNILPKDITHYLNHHPSFTTTPLKLEKP